MENHIKKQENGTSPQSRKSRTSSREDKKYLKRDQWRHSVYIQKQRRPDRMWRLQTNIHNAKTIYKIWHGLIARKLTKITHILTRNNQYGYKEGISTIDAIIKIEQYIEHDNRDAKILPMDFSEAFGTINRTTLWDILYRKGLPGGTIKHTRRGNPGKNYHRNIKGNMEGPKYQYRSISTIRHQCDTIHNLHGRHDGGLRRNEPTTKSTNQDCTRQATWPSKNNYYGKQ